MRIRRTWPGSRVGGKRGSCRGGHGLDGASATTCMPCRLSLTSPPLYRDNRRMTRTGGFGDSGRMLARVNRIALGPLEELEDVVLQNRAEYAPWRCHFEVECSSEANRNRPLRCTPSDVTMVVIVLHSTCLLQSGIFGSALRAHLIIRAPAAKRALDAHLGSLSPFGAA